MTERRAVVAIGSNVPAPGHESPRETVLAALGALRRIGPTRVSGLYSTPAWPPGSGPGFVNACACVVTDMQPIVLLSRLHAIERAHARARLRRWGPRTLDLDLVALGARIAPSRAGWARWRRLPERARAEQAPRRLVLPHPRLEERAFVLVPMCDVAPGWRHPVTGLSARAMRDRLPPERRAEIVRLG